MLFKIKYIDKFSIKRKDPKWIIDEKTYLGQDAHTRADELIALGYLVEMTKI